MNANDLDRIVEEEEALRKKEPDQYERNVWDRHIKHLSENLTGMNDRKLAIEACSEFFKFMKDIEKWPLNYKDPAQQILVYLVEFTRRGMNKVMEDLKA